MGPNGTRNYGARFAHGYVYPSLEERLFRLRATAGRRWQSQGNSAAVGMLGDRAGARRAAFLLGMTLACSTQAAYQLHWEAFESFCELYRSVSIPATPATVSCYLSFFFDKVTICDGSIRPYIAAIGAQHRHCGLSDPTDDPLVSSTKLGYVSNYATHQQGAPLRSIPLPATMTLRALHRALSSAAVDGFRR